MGRIKAQPKRKARTITIVGAAAHAALASVVLPDDDEEEGIATTPLQGNEAAKRRLKKLIDDHNEKDEDSDDETFETYDGGNVVKKKKRVKLACDFVGADKATPKTRRRLTFDSDDHAYNDKRERAPNKSTDGIIQTNNNDGNCLTIQQAEDNTTISISSPAYRKSTSTSACELVKFHLPNTKMLLVDDNNGFISNYVLGKIALTDTSDVELLLQYCNQSLSPSDFDNSVEGTAILRAFEDEMLEICLLPTINNFYHQVIVSINLLLIDSLRDDKNAAPPIPVPRQLPWNRRNNSLQQLSKPHPSYVMIQALGSIFKGSIFDDVAKSHLFFNGNNTQQHAETRPKQKDSKKSIITAGMVYSVVDNLHAKEYEQPPNSRDTSSLSPSLSVTSPLQIPGLLPQLRPYQEAAVRWMIKRERSTASNDEWELCWYVIVSDTAANNSPASGSHYVATLTRCNIIPLSEWKSGKSSPDEKKVFCNPFVGWIASTYEDAKYLMFGTKGEVYHPKGGILAEQMGLGKTVEVIACMLANPSPLAINVNNSNDNQSLPTTKMDTSQLSPADEAVSIYQSKTIVKSRATLIVTPPSILTQWQREISRHATNMKVVIYPGIKDLCCRSSSPSTRHDNFHFVNPRVLADADVVLVTFQVLNSDLGHSDENPYTGNVGRLRQQKRHIVLPSPLTSIEWHRVCLDEAQRVEAPTTASARMARKLITERRWCVSGTPIGRGQLNDLYGLFLFLSFHPFDEKNWFINSFILSQGDAMKRLSHLLRKVMWRSTKQNDSVREQMGIPEQVEKKVILHFSSVEKYFYNKQYEEALRSIQRWSAAGRPEKLNLAINRLRAACCHPQVGASGIRGRGGRQNGSNSVLSMDEILNKLIDESKVRCEEAQRLVVLHTNGLACLSKLKAESTDSSVEKQKHLEKSLATYQEAIDLMDKSSLPSILLGSAVLGGSVGFRLSGKTVCCDSLTLEWQMKPTNWDNLGAAWSEVNFTTSKRISCVKIRRCQSLPSDLRETACNWTMLQPKECTLQISSASDGGGFVDVGSISFTQSDEGEDSWKEISGFRAKKTKACRMVIKSFGIQSCTHVRPNNYYVGLDVQFFEPRVSDDPLQRLHTLHNASMVLSSILQGNNLETNDGDARERLAKMENEAQSIQDNYMTHAQAIHRQRKYQLTTSILAREKCSEGLNNISDGSVRTWYEDYLGWLSLYGSESQQREMCEAVADELRSYYDNMDSRSGLFELDQILFRRGRFPGFNNIDGLHAALQIRIQQGRDEVGNLNNADQNKCLQNLVENLSAVPSSGEVLENSNCKRCRSDWHQTGPVCRHCYFEDDLVKFERLSNDPEISSVLKVMAKVVKNHLSRTNGQQKSFFKSLHERAARDLELRRLIREEIKTAKTFWRAHFDLLSDIDELNQCKSTMRLRRECEDVSTLSQNEAAFIVDPTRIAAEYCDHEAKQALAFAEMRRSDDCLRFLLNQRKKELVHNNTDPHCRETSICAICLASFQDERSVLSCGHCFHTECVQKLFSRYGGTIRCPMRCAVTTKREDLFLASNKCKNDGSRTCQEIKGDWGTKVNRLIGDVIDTFQIGDKGLILSQWEDMLDIVAEGLSENNIRFIRPHGGKRFGEDVKRFRFSDCPMLLLNVKNGAEGLTLTEANHCFMLEPILNHSIDAQAINRIHRIGQMSKTYVHRYIVADTIEEKIDAMRVERLANHFEEDVIQERTDHFDQMEVEQIFA